ncbi:type III-B CRISPR module RAMP protein Cmr1 [uncultured Lamprocystis sp.]|jgi:CRISPR-associated protein Cmr1|uniref:type III-B CRISPR module RAMP protein Cmr1 n=1 Tax=uncultured Lamprocystis sp. TaxID=543132 RepID=UPI0025E5CA4B|nr:type III-B CRISPR module RAMP protein Cmr1 [uncultured Lamprocystis sp.]
MAEVVEATFRIVTPMFLGGANQKVDDGIRPPSIKGALRFWWRALHWGLSLQATGGSPSKALEHLHRSEARLFGSAADDNGAGQGRFLLNAQYAGRALKTNELPPTSAGHQYLLGQGLYHFKQGYLRSALEPGELRLRLLFRPGTDHTDRESVARALLALGLLGGLGSRGRKGFGSLALQDLTGTDLTVPCDFDHLQEAFLKLITMRPDTLPPYTAFSTQSRIDAIPGVHRNSWELLGDLGREMQQYRSWGLNGKVAGVPSEKNFTDDHDLARDAVLANPIKTHPRRAVFGLPHNYFFSSLAATNNKLDINAVAPQSGGGWSDIGANRRASPLFIHLHEFPNHQRAAVLTLLPAQFLPDTWRIGLKSKGPVRRVDVTPDWTVLHGFMDRFAERHALLEPRP